MILYFNPPEIEGLCIMKFPSETLEKFMKMWVFIFQNWGKFLKHFKLKHKKTLKKFCQIIFRIDIANVWGHVNLYARGAGQAVAQLDVNYGIDYEAFKVSTCVAQRATISRKKCNFTKKILLFVQMKINIFSDCNEKNFMKLHELITRYSTY